MGDDLCNEGLTPNANDFLPAETRSRLKGIVDERERRRANRRVTINVDGCAVAMIIVSLSVGIALVMATWGAVPPKECHSPYCRHVKDGSNE